MQLVPAMEQGGVERGIVEMNREIVAAGHVNYVVCAGGRLCDTLTKDGANVICCDIKSKNILTFFHRARELRKILEAVQPDAVVAHSRLPAWLFLRANRNLGIPWVSFAHGANSVSPYSRVMTKGSLVVTPSQYIADYLKQHYPAHVDPARIRVIPRAIDRERFDPARLDAAFVAAKREEWGLAGRYVVMGLGRITQLKGYDTLVAAASLLHGKIPSLKLVIVGEAEEKRRDVESALRSQVAALGMEEHVVFAGNQQKVAECLSLADVVASSNIKKPEAFGRSMAEALAMSKPVVATAFGGALEIVQDGVNGFLVPEANADAQGFADAIYKVSQTKFGDLRTPAIEKFSFERMVAQSLAVYGELAEMRRR